MLSCLSRVQLFVMLWTVARQASLSMGFFRQEYWNGLPFPSLGDLPGPGIKPGLLPVDSLPLSHQGSCNCIVVISEVEICTLVCVCVLREGGELWKKGQGGNIAGLEDGREVMSQGMQ